MNLELKILSFDEDLESPKSSSPVKENSALTNSTETSGCLNPLKEKLQMDLISSENLKKHEEQAGVEVAYSLSCSDKSLDKDNFGNSEEGDKSKNHSNNTNNKYYKKNPLDKNIRLKNNLNDKVTAAKMLNNKNSNLKEPLGETKIVKVSASKIFQDISSVNKNKIVKKSDVSENKSYVVGPDTKKRILKVSKIFPEFSDYCAFIKKKPRYRDSVLKSFIRYVSYDDPEYIQSYEFKTFVKRYTKMISRKNLFFLANSILEMLKLIKKRYIKIQKIIKQLRQMSCIIRELEKRQVDFSGEENSVYLKLQRFREKFWLMYRRLNKYTKDISLDRVFSYKIHFSETDNPKINKCIEKWLNETKPDFPDFADVMKMSENEKNKLNLPSDQDSFRSRANEVFQKVGNSLQRKRKDELWASLCGFLESEKDPTLKNPELEKGFKSNYETRMMKEEEIYQTYVERQEKGFLNPTEVSEEDVYRFPESGNEKEEETLSIEKSLADRLTDEIKTNYKDEEKQTSNRPTNENNVSSNQKESKNNFKNYKSSKRRLENEGISKNAGLDNLVAETEIGDGQKRVEAARNSSNVQLSLVKTDLQENIGILTAHPPSLPVDIVEPPKKPGHPSESVKKGSLIVGNFNYTVSQDEGGKSLNKPSVFDVGHCQIVTNLNFKERKVFRDLTNVIGLMKKPGLRDKMIGLTTPMFLYGRYPPKEETPWKKRVRLNLKETKPKNQKCALNEEDKTSGKISSGSSRDSEDKDSKNNSESGPEGEDFSAQGNGQEEDNNDKGDENRKNGKIEEENDDHEEDDDEEKEDENAEAGEHSSNMQKTERENEDSLEASTKENHALGDTGTSSVENNDTCTEQDIIFEDVVQGNKGEAECDKMDGNLENNSDYDDEFCRDAGNKLKDSEDVEEFENLKNSLEPICVLKEEDTSDVIEKANNEGPINVHQKSKKDNKWKINEKLKDEKFKTTPFTRSKFRAGMVESRRNESHNQKRLPMTAAWTPPPVTSQSKPRKMSASDEERVKRFLMHSPSSISITPPKKLTLSKPPSQSALQALATLRNLKGISATIVKGKPKTDEDVSVIGGQSRRRTDQSTPIPAKKRRTDLPVISNVQSVNTLTPKIVTVQGNVSGFENLWPEMKNHGNKNSDPSSIRISKVWGSLPETVVQANPSNYPGCSSRKSNPSTSNQARKKNSKKQVEYVVLD